MRCIPKDHLTPLACSVYVYHHYIVSGMLQWMKACHQVQEHERSLHEHVSVVQHADSETVNNAYVIS